MKRLLTVCMLLALVATAAFAGKEDTKNVPVAKQQEIMDMDKLINLYHDGAELTEAQKIAVLNYVGEGDWDRGGEPSQGLDGVGGPDAFGYRWVDNQGGDTATFSFIDIASTGTLLPLSSNADGGSDPVSWGWNFPFYGTNFTGANVTTDGLIQFSVVATAFSNTCTLPSTARGPAVMVFWDDLDSRRSGTGVSATVSDSGAVYFQNFGTHAVIQWDSVGRFSPSFQHTYTFQAVLYPDGKIKLQYREISTYLPSTTHPSPTIAIQQGPAATPTLTYLCFTTANAAANIAGRAVWFYPAPPAPGRCCYLSGGHGVCADILLSECTALGGQFNPSLLCATAPCPVGRCCYSGGCVDVMQLECTFLGGTWSATLTCAANPCPIERNGSDLCADAVAISLGQTYVGNNSAATPEVGIPACGTGYNATAKGVWYTVTGTGNTMTATMCDPTVPTFDTELFVFCGTCDALTCVGSNDDATCTGGSGLTSTFSWCSQNGAQYYILATAFSTGSGVFPILVTDNGTPCTGPINCFPVGRCCYTNTAGIPSCANVTAAECDVLGGEFNATATCESAPCYGSCCYIIHGEGFCSDEAACADGVTAAACATLGGAWTAGGICAEQPCLAPLPCTCRCSLTPNAHGIFAVDATTYPILDVTVNDFTINVPVEYHITDLNVAIDAIHTFDGDVEIRLTSPMGTTVILSDNRGGGGDNWFCTEFDDEATTAVAAGVAPFTGSWIPDAALSAFDGENAVGNWTLTFHDQVGGDFGYLIGACLKFEYDVILPVAFGSFDAVTGNERVTLNWNTSSESSVDFFEVTRDGAVIANVDAQNSATGATYSYSDENLTNGTSYSYSLTAVDVNGVRQTLATLSATPSGSAVISEYALHQNYPNPFNPTTNIAFDMVEAGHVSVSIFNVMGQKVAEIVNGNMEAGRHVVTFDATSLSSGLYLYKMEANGFTAQAKMVLMK